MANLQIGRRNRSIGQEPTIGEIIEAGLILLRTRGLSTFRDILSTAIGHRYDWTTFVKMTFNSATSLPTHGVFSGHGFFK